MIKVGIVGGTGYTGVELMRLLAVHSDVCLQTITSRANAGAAVADFYPNLRGIVDVNFSEPELDSYRDCDLVLFATPSATAMYQAKALLLAGKKVIDLAADFRLKDVALWEEWYGEKHACPELVEQAVYGLPEINRVAIKSADLVANPGCYPTAVILGLLPLLHEGLIDTSSIIADCKSGTSGAGRKANVGTAYCEIADSFKAYGVSGHRHLPEIIQVLQSISPTADLVFIPHLLPLIRGMHATVYADNVGSVTDVQSLYEAFYKNESFVDVMPAGSHPETRSVKAANTCRLAVHYLARSNKYVVLSVIDNLMKGAAGQAVQNMNLMLGFEEHSGLQMPGLMP